MVASASPLLPIPLPRACTCSKTSFLPPTIKRPVPSTLIRRPRTGLSATIVGRPLSVSSLSLPIQIVRCPALDRRVIEHSRLRFVRKLTILLLSKPRGFLPLRVLSRCRAYLAPPRSRSLISMILRYPTIFRLFHAPSRVAPSFSLLSVALTPAAAALAADEACLRDRHAPDLAAKLQRLLLLSAPHHRILLSKLAHLAPDLGLSPDFRSRLCDAHPDRFRTVGTACGRALELVARDPALAAPLPLPLLPRAGRPIIDRPPKFGQLRLRRGLNLRRRHRDFLIQLQCLPQADPYSPPPAGAWSEAAEKRACAAVREVLGMTVERRTLVDHLTHFRRELGLPNRLRAMLVRHPEMFYVSIKGQRDSVFLVEAYDDNGRLLADEQLLQPGDRLVELVREGKKMRREWRLGLVCGAAGPSTDGDGGVDDDEEEEVDDCGDESLECLFGDGWEEVEGEGIEEEEEEEMGELWFKKVAADGENCGASLLVAW